jgi:hypothetical protein
LDGFTQLLLLPMVTFLTGGESGFSKWQEQLEQAKDRKGIGYIAEAPVSCTSSGLQDALL